MKSVAKIFLLFALLMASIHHTVSAKALMRFKSPIAVNATNLSDIVEITNGKQGSCDLALLRLGSKSVSGQVITKEQVIKWIHRQANCHEVQLKWLGKTKAHISGNIQSSSTQLIALASDALKKQLTRHYSNIEITLVTLVNDSGKAINEFKPHVQTTLAKRMRVLLDSPQQTISIWFKVKAEQKVLLTSHTLIAKQALQQEDISTHQVDVSGYLKVITKLPHDCRLKHAMEKDSVITGADIEAIPLVIAGNHIVTVAVQKGITLKDQAMALNDGNKGQMIWVKNPSSNKRYRAKIIGKNTVEVIS